MQTLKWGFGKLVANLKILGPDHCGCNHDGRYNLFVAEY